METPDPKIATATQEATNASCSGVVVEMKPAFCIPARSVSATDRADSTLLSEQPSIGAVRHAKPRLKGDIGLGVGIIATPLAAPGSSLRMIGPVAPAGREGNARFAPNLGFVAPTRGYMKLRERFDGLASQARLPGRRLVSGRPATSSVGVFLEVPPRLIGDGAGTAARGQSVLMRLVPIELSRRLGLVALKAGFGYSRIAHGDVTDRYGKGRRAGFTPARCLAF